MYLIFKANVLRYAAHKIAFFKWCHSGRKVFVSIL